MLAADVVSFLRHVQMPGVEHLLHGNLEPARAALRALTPERDLQQWVALHVILGTALRLRAPNLPAHERAEACLEALRAFENALAECWESSKACSTPAVRGSSQRVASSSGAARGVRSGEAASAPDGVQIVVDALSDTFGDGVALLERAVRVFTDESARAERCGERRAWVMARSNLGCALMLLGKRTEGRSGAQRIEQAIDVLLEAARVGEADALLEERASICVNLSEAFQMLAGRMLPGERLRHLERSLDWMAAAIGTFAPDDYRWLLELDRAAVA